MQIWGPDIIGVHLEFHNTSVNLNLNLDNTGSIVESVVNAENLNGGLPHFSEHFVQCHHCLAMYCLIARSIMVLLTKSTS